MPKFAWEQTENAFLAEDFVAGLPGQEQIEIKIPLREQRNKEQCFID